MECSLIIYKVAVAVASRRQLPSNRASTLTRRRTPTRHDRTIRGLRVEFRPSCSMSCVRGNVRSNVHA